MKVNQLTKYEGGNLMTGKKVVRMAMAGVLVLTLGIVFSGCATDRITAVEQQSALALSKAEEALGAVQSAQSAADAAAAKADDAAAQASAAADKADAAAASAAQADAAAQSAAKSAQKAEAVFMKNMGK
jgi:hypothetical protein